MESVEACHQVEFFGSGCDGFVVKRGAWQAEQLTLTNTGKRRMLRIDGESFFGQSN